METLKAMLKKLLFPGWIVISVTVPAAAVLLTYTFTYGSQYSPTAYISYVLSAYGLTIVCARIYGIPKQVLTDMLYRNKYVRRYLTDIVFKTHVSLYISLGINLLFAAMKLLFGVWYGSVWFGTRAVYYMMLAGMRFLLLRHVSRKPIGSKIFTEWMQYRLCGVILLVMNIALSGVVTLVVTKNESFRYDGYLIYVVALYAFYNIITAVRDVFRYAQYKSPIISAAKAVKLAAALVSMLSLETAMLMQFNDRADGEHFRQVMTAATGGAVCVLVLAIAVVMIVRATRQLDGQGSMKI